MVFSILVMVAICDAGVVVEICDWYFRFVDVAIMNSVRHGPVPASTEIRGTEMARRHFRTRGVAIVVATFDDADLERIYQNIRARSQAWRRKHKAHRDTSSMNEERRRCHVMLSLHGPGPDSRNPSMAIIALDRVPCAWDGVCSGFSRVPPLVF